MADFIFHVDLSTIYIILRRDFFAPEDAAGQLSSPLGSGFYYSAALANEAARAYCIKEAARGPRGEGAVHLDEDGLYVGGCVTREDWRDHFEVRVKRLRAKGGSGTRSGGGEVVRGESRAGGLAAVKEEEDEVEVEVRGRERSGTPTGSLRASTGRKMGRLWSRIRKEG